MGLTVPIVGQEPGPQYATDINGDMTLIDQHNHTPGLGVPVPSSGISFNADLSANNNRLTYAKSVTFTAQSMPLSGVLPDLGAIYVSGVDLYYNDENGNQIRITQSGGIAGSPGSISGLTPPASASYSSGSSKFIWQSAVNTSAGMDNGPVTIRQNSASAKGITIQSPNSLAADYSITLLTGLPASTSFLEIDSSGNMTAASSIIQSQTVRRTSSQTAGIGQLMVSPGSGSFSTASVVPVNVTNLSGTLDTTGNPVKLRLIPDVGTTAQIRLVNNSGGALTQGIGNLQLLNGATVVAAWVLGPNVMGVGSVFALPPSSMEFIDFAAAGTQSYDLQANVTSPGGYSIDFLNCVLIAEEM